MGLFSKISRGLKKTRDSFTGAVNSVISSFTKVDDELFEELEETLILADTGVNTANAICEELKKRVKAERVTDPNLITDMLKQVIIDMMSADNSIKTNTKPSMILVIGVNGAGKTTSIGKMASM